VSAIVTLESAVTALDTSNDTDDVAGDVACWSSTAPRAGAVRKSVDISGQDEFRTAFA